MLFKNFLSFLGKTPVCQIRAEQYWLPASLGPGLRTVSGANRTRSNVARTATTAPL